MIPSPHFEGCRARFAHVHRWLGLASLALLAALQPVVAQNWVLTTAPSRNWSAVFSSASGTNLAAVADGDTIYVSANGGIKWSKTSAPKTNWSAIAGSADGKRLVAAGGPGPIYTSADSGATWTARSAPTTNYWFALASSADGTRLAAAADRDGLFTSPDSGATWNKAAVPEQQWFALASSADGMELVAAGDPGLIFVSTDGGQTWITNNAPLLSWSALTISADGTRLMALAALDGIYISTNSGTDWSKTSTTNDFWYAAASSANGNTLYAASSQGIYKSTNGGGSWSQQDASQRAWNSISCAADGSDPFATAHGGIYVPIDSPAAAANSSLLGRFQGLFFETNEIAVESSGFFSANLHRQSYSAKLQLGGFSYAFSGRLSGGVSSNSILRSNLPPLKVQLKVTPRGDGLDGTVSDGSWLAQLAINQATYSRTNKAPQAGKRYTLAMSAIGESLAIGDGISQPGGVGFGMVSVDTAGNVAFRGKLNDGTPLVEKTFVSTSAQWPLYASLYGNKGLLIGWLSFLTTPGSDVAGAVSWIKLPQPQTQFYPAGFTNETETIGSIYRFTNGFPALNWRTGQVAMVSASILTQNITNRVTLNPTNNTWAGEEDLKFRINAPTGLFNGRTANPSTGKAVVFNGVVLQRQNTGFGYFLGRHQTGVVLVQSAK